ncbi:MAG: phage portal protein, partial [Niameybacter sp.]
YLDKELSLEMMEKYIELFRTSQLPRLQKLKRYYDCKNDTIMNRTFKDITKPNNKIATAWASYITTLTTGYFMGKPVTYHTDNNELNEYLHKSNTKEISHNAALEKDCSIFGYAAEILYINENKEIDFAKVDPMSIIPIY